MINSCIGKFVSKYSNGYQMFNEQDAKGLGTSKDLNVLSWMFYEGIYSTEEELIEATAYLLGRALARYAGFEWGEIKIANSNKIILSAEKSDYIFTPLEYTLIKQEALWRGNYGVDDLFFDAIFLSEYAPENEDMHPLFMLEYSKEYQDKLGFNIPDNIKFKLEKFYNQDKELLLRNLGVDFYEEYYAEDWEIIETKLKQIDLFYKGKI